MAQADLPHGVDLVVADTEVGVGSLRIGRSSLEPSAVGLQGRAPSQDPLPTLLARSADSEGLVARRRRARLALPTGRGRPPVLGRRRRSSVVGRLGSIRIRRTTPRHNERAEVQEIGPETLRRGLRRALAEGGDRRRSKASCLSRARRSGRAASGPAIPIDHCRTRLMFR